MLEVGEGLSLPLPPLPFFAYFAGGKRDRTGSLLFPSSPPLFLLSCLRRFLSSRWSKAVFPCLFLLSSLWPLPCCPVMENQLKAGSTFFVFRSTAYTHVADKCDYSDLLFLRRFEQIKGLRAMEWRPEFLFLSPPFPPPPPLVFRAKACPALDAGWRNGSLQETSPRALFHSRNRRSR